MRLQPELCVWRSSTLEKTSEDTALRNHADLTAKDVFDEAKAGDKVALEVVDEVCGILGAALSNIACVVNPGGSS